MLSGKGKKASDERETPDKDAKCLLRSSFVNGSGIVLNCDSHATRSEPYMLIKYAIKSLFQSMEVN